MKPNQVKKYIKATTRLEHAKRGMGKVEDDRYESIPRVNDYETVAEPLSELETRRAGLRLSLAEGMVSLFQSADPDLKPAKESEPNYRSRILKLPGSRLPIGVTLILNDATPDIADASIEATHLRLAAVHAVAGVYERPLIEFSSRANFDDVFRRTPHEIKNQIGELEDQLESVASVRELAGLNS